MCISLTSVLTAVAQPPRLVSLDVSATDSKGRFVPDLRASELRLADAGRVQPIIFFRRGDTLPHAVAILIDQLNGDLVKINPAGNRLHRGSDLEQKASEWSKILRAVSHTESTWDAFLYVLTPSGALYPIRPMPDAWAGWTPPDLDWDREVFTTLDRVRNAYRELSDYTNRPDPRLHDTAWAIEELRTRLAGIPGHAAVIWAGPSGSGKSEIVPHNSRYSDRSEIRNVPVYVSGSPSARGPEATSIQAYSDIKEVIPRAAAEAQQYYRIGWQPASDNWNGKLHSVRITCTRPGVHVTAKETYDAPQLLDVTDDQRQAVPDLLPLITFNSSQIRFTADMVGTRVNFHIDPADLVPHDGVAHVAVGIMEAAPGESRDLIGGVRTFDLPADSIAMEIPGPVPAVIRVIVYDRVSGAFATRTIRRSL